jgi:hypothetical protein
VGKPLGTPPGPPRRSTTQPAYAINAHEELSTAARKDSGLVEQNFGVQCYKVHAEDDLLHV